MRPSALVVDSLRSAYFPCPGFQSSCTSMRWKPYVGHVPRGFCGATGTPGDVRLVLVCAEPGDPHPREAHLGDGTPDGYLESAYSYAWGCFENGRDLYHRNLRHLLNECWPGQTFEQQMQKTWTTESVLCSAEVETGRVAPGVERACAQRFLRPQLALFPRATVVALGRKAQGRLRRVGVTEFHSAFAVAPPGCNMPGARESWRRVGAMVRSLGQ